MTAPSACHRSGSVLRRHSLPANALHAAFGVSASRTAGSGAGPRPVLANPEQSPSSARDIPGENNYGGAVHDDRSSLTPRCSTRASRSSPSRHLLRGRTQSGAQSRIAYDELPASSISVRHLRRRAMSAERRLVRAPRTQRSLARRDACRERSRSEARTTSIWKADAIAIPQEDGAMLIHSSTQHPTEVQHVVAHAGSSGHSVTVQCRRMAGFRRQGKSTALIAAAQRSWRAKPAGREAAPGSRYRHDHDASATTSWPITTSGSTSRPDPCRVDHACLAVRLFRDSRAGQRSRVYHSTTLLLEHVEIASHRCKTNRCPTPRSAALAGRKA